MKYTPLKLPNSFCRHHHEEVQWFDDDPPGSCWFCGHEGKTVVSDSRNRYLDYMRRFPGGFGL